MYLGARLVVPQPVPILSVPVSITMLTGGGGVMDDSSPGDVMRSRIGINLSASSLDIPLDLIALFLAAPILSLQFSGPSPSFPMLLFSTKNLLRMTGPISLRRTTH